jgi:peptidoglycan/LPS O-acetylase OafA/YrhL
MTRKIGLAVVLGAILGAFDGMTAWFEPAVRDQIGTIVLLSSLKSVIAGLLIGIFACYVKRRSAAALFGLAVGLLLAYLVAMSPDPKTGEHYYAQIMVPGALVGLIVGYATARYGDKPAATTA